MTLLPYGVRDTMRNTYRLRIHNQLTPVKKIISTSENNVNPNYEPSSENVLALYTDFYCSYYNVLSGKTDRVFNERDPLEQLPQFGLVADDVYIVQYVVGLDLTPDVPGDPAKTSDMEIGEQIYIDGQWWLVRKVINDSEGIQSTLFVIK